MTDLALLLQRLSQLATGPLLVALVASAIVVSLIRNHASRIASLHLRDYQDGAVTTAGEGVFINEARGIEDKLAADPRLTDVKAIKNQAYVLLSYNEGGVETPRNVDALERMIDGLIALK